MKAIVTVIGKDKTGIIASISTELAKMKINIEDISQTVMQDYFAMIMLADVTQTGSIGNVSKQLKELGEKIGVDIRIQHEDLFNSMHRI